MDFIDFDFSDISPLVIINSELLNNIDDCSGTIKLPNNYNNSDVLDYIQNHQIIMTTEFINLIDFLLIINRDIKKEIILKIKLKGDKEFAQKALELNYISLDEFTRWFNIISYNTFNVEGVIFTMRNEYFEEYFRRMDRKIDIDYPNIFNYKKLKKNGHLEAIQYLIKNKKDYIYCDGLKYLVDKSNIQQYINPDVNIFYIRKLVKYCNLEQLIQLFVIGQSRLESDRHFLHIVIDSSLDHVKIDFIDWIYLHHNDILSRSIERHEGPKKLKYNIKFYQYLSDKFPNRLKSMLQNHIDMICIDEYRHIEELKFLFELDYSFDKITLFFSIIKKNNLDDVKKFVKFIKLRITPKILYFVCTIDNEEIFDFVLSQYNNNINDIYPIIIGCAYDKPNYVEKLYDMGFPIHPSAILQTCKNNHLNMLQKLVRLGATPDINALFFASGYGYTECVEYLKSLELKNLELTDRNLENEVFRLEDNSTNSTNNSLYKFYKNYFKYYASKLYSKYERYSIFKTYTKIGSPYKLDIVEKFEKKNNIQLPEDFKYYITNYSRSIGYYERNDEWNKLFNIYHVKIQDLFELSHKNDLSDKEHKYFSVHSEFICDYVDKETRKYNYYKVPANIAHKYFIKDEYSSLYFNEYKCVKNYLISGEIDYKLKKIRKIKTIEELENSSKYVPYTEDLYLQVHWRFDSVTTQIIPYNSNLEKQIATSLEEHEEDIDEHDNKFSYFNVDKILYKSRKIKFGDSECGPSVYFLLDGIYKGKIILSELNFQGESYFDILIDSFIDFIAIRTYGGF